jgi:hypothetical protein
MISRIKKVLRIVGFNIVAAVAILLMAVAYIPLAAVICCMILLTGGFYAVATLFSTSDPQIAIAQLREWWASRANQRVVASPA